MNNSEKLFVIDHPLVKKDVTILRDEDTKPEMFRAALTRISNILAVEISKDVPICETTVKTPLENTKGYQLEQEIILVPVLRAGLGMVNGFLQIIPDAKVGHIGLQRNEETLEPIKYYFKVPGKIENAKVIILDPMLATGGSASEAINYLLNNGVKDLAFACIVAAPEGVKRINADHPEIKIFTVAYDRQLNSKGYILPGLGDAGDRTFGTL